MKREPIDDEALGAYLDGELSPVEADRVRQAVAEDSALEATLTRQARLGDAVRASDPDLEARLGDARDSDALFARIEADLGAPAAAQVASTSPSKLAPVVDLGARRRRLFAATSVFVAAAAALFVVLRPARLTHDGTTIGPSLGDIPRGSEILDIDFGKSTGTTFSVEGVHGEPLAVVWINDSDVALK